MKICFKSLLVFAFCLIAQGVAAPSQQKPTQIHIKDLMTASEFGDAGLKKLTHEELVSLDAWLTRHTEKVLGIVREKSTAPESTAAIETQIDGEFNGWEGETIFKLANGQIWQQSSQDYTYEYAYRPDVIIYKTSDCWKMKVEDVDDTICVRRIK